MQPPLYLLDLFSFLFSLVQYLIRYEVLWNVSLAFTLACWWVPTLRSHSSIAHVFACNHFALAYVQLALSAWLELTRSISVMNVYSVYSTQQSWAAQPQHFELIWMYSNYWIKNSIKVSALHEAEYVWILIYSTCAHFCSHLIIGMVRSIASVCRALDKRVIEKDIAVALETDTRPLHGK